MRCVRRRSPKSFSDWVSSNPVVARWPAFLRVSAVRSYRTFKVSCRFDVAPSVRRSKRGLRAGSDMSSTSPRPRPASSNIVRRVLTPEGCGGFPDTTAPLARRAGCPVAQLRVPAGARRRAGPAPRHGAHLRPRRRGRWASARSGPLQARGRPRRASSPCPSAEVLTAVGRQIQATKEKEK